MASFNLLDNVLGFPTLTHVQRNYAWDFLFPDLFGILISGAVVSKYCQSVRIGQYDISEISEMKIGPYKRFFPNILNIEPATVTFVAPVPDLVTLYFSQWKKMIVDKKGRFNVASQYKRAGYIILYDRSGIPSNMIRLVGMFPVKFPGFNLDYNAQDSVKFEVTIRYDRLEMGLTALGSAISGVVGAVGGAVSKIGSIF